VKHVHQARTLRHQPLKRMDDEEESVVRKLRNTDDSTKNLSEMASTENQSTNGVTYIKGDQGYPDSWGGMDKEDIDNHGNNAVDYQQLNQSSSNTQSDLPSGLDLSQQDGLLTPSPQCTSPF